MDRSVHVDRIDRAERIDIVVKGRHTEVTERFREHAKEKLGRLERLDPKAYRIDVEVCHEANPRLAGSCERVELTLHSRGPVVRAEAAAQDPYAALDVAVAKLEERLRRAADRRRARHQGHYGHATSTRGVLPPDAEAIPAPSPRASTEARQNGNSSGDAGDAGDSGDGAGSATGLADLESVEAGIVMAAGPLLVREKAHDATPMTLDDALHRMELVGHDFYLYCCADTGLPSVVYRRRGYTYGVLRLRTQEPAGG